MIIILKLQIKNNHNTDNQKEKSQTLSETITLPYSLPQMNIASISGMDSSRNWTSTSPLTSGRGPDDDPLESPDVLLRPPAITFTKIKIDFKS